MVISTRPNIPPEKIWRPNPNWQFSFEKFPSGAYHAVARFVGPGDSPLERIIHRRRRARTASGNGA